MIVPDRLDRIERKLLKLEVDRPHKGISTAAEWVASLRRAGILTRNVVDFDPFLQRRAE